MKSMKRTCHVADVAAAAPSTVHVTCVMTNPLPIIREPSFKSELHIPIIPANKTKRLSPLMPPPPPPQTASPSVFADGFPFKKFAKRLSKESNRGSTESLNCSLRGSQDDMISLRSFKDATLSPFINKSPVWFRKKYVERQESHRRQMSCKDLGGSDCEGWLRKKEDGGKKKWIIRWFMLNGKKLRYYKHEDDEEPQGVIHLPGLKISPAPEVKHKKFAFKAHHSGTTFFFAAESQEDMVKWMNKMGLASLEALDLNRSCTTAGFKPSDKVHLDLDDTGDDASSGCRSDSDAESIESLGCGGSRLSSRPSSQRSSFASSKEDLVDLYDKLYRSNIGLDGSNIRDKRSTAFFSTAGDIDEEHHAYLRIITLRRTLQDKEEQLKAINDLLLERDSLTSEDIVTFRKNYPNLVAELEETNRAECQNDKYRPTNDDTGGGGGGGGSDSSTADPDSTPVCGVKTQVSRSVKSLSDSELT